MMVGEPSLAPARRAPVHPSYRGQRDLEAYGGIRTRRAVEVYAPTSEPALANLIARLRERGRRFAPLGACLAFDGQGLPESVAIETSGLDHLHVDVGERRLIAGAGVTTGRAAAAALLHGMMIPVVPSTSRVTLGGSASSDAYSRMTPGLGRESRHIRAIRLLTPCGEALRCSRHDNADLFHAAVGGFGLTGIITEVEYALLDIGCPSALRSSAHAFEGVDGLAHLVPENLPNGLAEGSWPGAGSVVIRRGDRLKTMLTRHRYEQSAERRPTVAHERGPMRLGIELFVRSMPGVASWFWERNWVPGRPLEFVDDVWSATFFMDANLDANALVRRLGHATTIIQQSFVLPADGRAASSALRVECFVREAMDRFRRADLHPTMFDVGFLPAAEPFVFASNPGFDAFLVSAAFLLAPRAAPAPVSRALEALTTVCVRDYGGTVHLTKQAFCSDQLLRDLYEEPIRRLRALRRAHDPEALVDTALGARLGL